MSIFRRIGRFGIRHGWDFRRQLLRFGDDLRHDLTLLLRLGDVVIDVGANTGQTVRLVLECQPACTVIAIEPNPPVFDELRSSFAHDDRVTALNWAISTTPGNQTLYGSQNSEWASLLKPLQSEYREIRGEVVVPATKLSELFEGGQIPPQVRLMKIDTQGNDLQVLDSLGPYLNPSTIEALLIEVSFDAYYERQTRPHEILNYLDQRDYWPVAWYPSQRLKLCKAVGWSDVLFLHRSQLVDP